MPKVSVIIPVYNVERYLGECLDSVLGQTLKDIEVICVDDGSMDGSAKILAEYAARDARVKVMRQENSGSGVARNLGMGAAKGRFLAFMDPDDFYPAADVLEKLLSAVEGSGCRVAGGRLQVVSGNEPGAKRAQAAWDWTGRFPPCGKVRYRDFQAPWGYTCYLYDRELICGNGIAFPAFKRFQDPPFFVRAMLAAGTFCAIPDCVYCYRVGEKKVDWKGDGGALQAEREKGYAATLELAEANSLERLADLVRRGSGKRKVDLYGRLMCRLCPGGNAVTIPPSEPETHDFFDGFRDGVPFDERLFVFLKRVLTSPAQVRRPLERIASERLLLARHAKRLAVSRFPPRRRLLLSWLMFKGAIRRRSRLPANLLSRLSLAFARPKAELLDEAPAPQRIQGREAAVIVPVYNGYDVLRRLCATLFDHTGPESRIIFVDDASPDERIAPYLASLAELHPNVEVLTNEENLGFPSSVNRGAARCTCDFVILNSDTEVPDGWIARLFAPIWGGGKVASAMPLTCEWTQSGPCNPGVISRERLERIGLQAADRAVARIRVKPAFCVSKNNLGFCLAISRKAWTEVGPFASDIFGFGYHEEADWCAVARYRFGYEHRIVPNLLVAHWHNGSFTSERRKRQLERNYERLRSRNPMRNFDGDIRYKLSRKAVADIAAKAFERGA
jgi:GT2 family glycosyltransferase